MTKCKSGPLLTLAHRRTKCCSPLISGQRDIQSLFKPLIRPKGEGTGIRKLTFLLKCTFGAVVWHELSLIDHELSLIIFDDSWSINDHSCPHKNISSALRALCVLKGIIILNSRFMPYSCSWSYGRLLHTVFLWSHTDSFLETLGKVLRGTEARHVGYFCDGAWCLA